MAHLVIDILGEEEAEDDKEKVTKLTQDAKPKRPRLRKQVINIDGEIVDLD